MVIQEQNRQERLFKLNQCARILGDFNLGFDSSTKQLNDITFDQYDKCMLEYSKKYESLDEQQIRIIQQAESRRAQQDAEYDSSLENFRKPDSLGDAVDMLERYKIEAKQTEERIKQSESKERIKTDPKEKERCVELFSHESVMYGGINPYQYCLENGVDTTVKSVIENCAWDTLSSNLELGRKICTEDWLKRVSEAEKIINKP